jgi:hypothetical protein
MTVALAVTLTAVVLLLSASSWVSVSAENAPSAVDIPAATNGTVGAETSATTEGHRGPHVEAGVGDDDAHRQPLSAVPHTLSSQAADAIGHVQVDEVEVQCAPRLRMVHPAAESAFVLSGSVVVVEFRFAVDCGEYPDHVFVRARESSSVHPVAINTTEPVVYGSATSTGA